MEDKNAPTSNDKENRGSETKPINPFDKHEVASANEEQMEEDAAAEQQRKEALTERD